METALTQETAQKSELRSELEVVREQLIAEMRRRCVDALYGRNGGMRFSVTTDLDELREMTKCPEFPEGLDFSTDNDGHRDVVYELRDEIAEEPGLYFIGERGVGVKWTAYAPRGIAWRVGEFSERSQPMAIQISRWAAIEATRMGNKKAAKAIQKVGHIMREHAVQTRKAVAEIDAALTQIGAGVVADNED